MPSSLQIFFMLILLIAVLFALEHEVEALFESIKPKSKLTLEDAVKMHIFEGKSLICQDGKVSRIQ